MLLVVVIWGSAASVTKYGVETVPPYFFAFLRNLVASLSLIPFYYHQKRKENGARIDLPIKRLFWMGLTGVTFFYLFFNLALYYTTASLGALIQGFIPVAIILLALVFLREKLKGLQITGVIISLVGVVMISFTDVLPGARNSFLGNTLMICSVICWAVYTIISKSVSQYNPVYVTAISTWIGTVGLIPAVIIEGWGHPMPAVDFNGWLAIIYLGIFSSTLCYLLYNWILRILPAVQVGNLMNLDPVVGAVIAIAFLHERLTALQIIGAVLVLVGVGMTSKK